jgi:hypothetical protein
MPNPRHEYGGCTIELCSFAVQATANSPAGWVPQARIWYEDGGAPASFPLTGPTIESTREEADAAILPHAKVRIDRGTLPRRKDRFPRSRRV